MDTVSRRNFLGAAAAMSAASYARVVGANDSIQIGLLGVVVPEDDYVKPMSADGRHRYDLADLSNPGHPRR